MANLLPLNTSYNDDPSVSRAAKVLRMPNSYSGAATQPADVSKYQNLIKPPEAQVVGESFDQTTPNIDYKTVYPGYSFDPLKTPNVSPTTRFSTLTKSIGGGQFAYDPANTSPDNIIRSERRFETPEEQLQKNVLLGGRSSSLYQVDHIYPIWLGGTDTLENKQVLNVFDHEQKTKVGEVARALYEAGKINKNEAVNLSLNWRDRDVSGVNLDQTQAIKGKGDKATVIIPLDQAEKAYKTWNTVRKPTAMEVIKGIPKAFKDTWHGLEQASADAVEMGGYMPPATGEFIKGVIRGATFGYYNMPARKPRAGEAEWEQTFNALAGVGGDVAGALVTFKMAEGLLMKGAQGLAASKLPGAATVGTRLTKILQFEGNPSTEVIWKQLKGSGQLTPAITKLLGSSAKAYAGRAAKNTLIFNAVGQMSAQGPEGDRLRRAFTDTAMALAMAGVPVNHGGKSKVDAIFKNTKGIATAGMAGTMIEYMNTGDVDSALMSGAIMAGLHGMGVAQGWKTGVSDEAEKIAMDAVIAHRTVWLKRAGLKPTEPPPIGASLEQRQAYGKKLLQENLKAQQEVTKAYHNEEIGEVEFNREIGKLIAGSRWLENITIANTTPKVERASILDSESKINWEQINRDNGITVPEHRLRLLPESGVRFIEGNPDMFFGGPRTLPTPETHPQLFQEISQKKFIATESDYRNTKGETVRPSEVQITAQGKVSEIKDNQVKFSKGFVADPEKPTYVLVTDSPERTFAAKLSGKYQGASAEKHLAVIGYKDGEFLNLGYIPDKANIETNMNPKQRKLAAQSDAGILRLFDPNTNKDTLHDNMVQNGVHSRIAQVVFATEKAYESGEPAIVIKFGKDVRGNDMDVESVLRSQNVKTKEWVSLDRIMQLTKKVAPTPPQEVQSTAKPVEPPKTDKVPGIKAAPAPQAPAQNSINPRRPVYEPIVNATPAERETRVAEAVAKAAVLKAQGPAKAPQQAELPIRQAVENLKQMEGAPEWLRKESPKVEPNFENKFYEEKPQLLVKETPKVEAAAPAEVKTEVVETKPKKEKPSSWRDFDLMSDGSEERVNRGAAKIINKKISELLGEGKTSEVSELSKKRDEFTRSKLTELAKEMSENGKDVEGGWPKFLSEVEYRLRSYGGDPNLRLNKKEESDLQWLYKRLSRGHARNEFVFKNKSATLQKTSIDVLGEADTLTKEFNAKNGLADDAMEVIGVNKDLDYSQGGLKPQEGVDSRNKFAVLSKGLSEVVDSSGNKVKFVPVGITAKGTDKVVAVKYEPKLVEMFDQDPVKYLNPKENLTSAEDKFLRVYMVDVLGLPKNLKAEDFVKRANLLYQRYDQYMGPDQDRMIVVHALKAKKLSEMPDSTIDAKKFENPNDEVTQRAVKTWNDGAHIDGKIIVGEQLYNRLRKAFNYFGTHETGMKPIISGMIKDEQGNTVKMLQKGHIIKADAALRDMLKEEYNLDLKPWEMATFDTNVKVGPKAGKFETPLSSFFAKDLKFEREGKSTETFERKFKAEDTGVAKDMVEVTKQRQKDYNELIEKIDSTKSKADLEKILTDFAERYNLDKDELFYGVMGDSYNLGAAKINLGHNLSRLAKNLFFDTVMTDEMANSGRAFISPDIKLPLDGFDKPKRYVADDEVVLGSEFMKRIGVAEGDQVIVLRDPSYDINNVFVAKVKDGTRLGHESLGDEHAMVSHYNERVKLQADQDGDNILITKVGEGGWPESYAKAIERRGKWPVPFTEVNKTEVGHVTTENIKTVINNQLVGDDQTSNIAKVNRIMDTLVDNNVAIRVFKSTDGKKSSYITMVNGKTVEEGTTAAVDVTFTARPKWGPEEKQLRSQALQEALDSKKSDDIVKHSENNNPSWMTKQTFSVVNSKGDLLNVDDKQARAINRALASFHTPLTIRGQGESFRGMADVMEELKPSIALFQKVQNAGGKLTPFQEKILALKDTKVFNVPDKVKLDADTKGSKALQQQLQGFVKPTKVALEFQAEVKKAKGEYFAAGREEYEKRREIRSRISEMFEKNLKSGKYSQEDLDAIAYWAATSPDANFGHAPNYGTAKYVYRFNNMINSSPKIAQTYYSASEAD